MISESDRLEELQKRYEHLLSVNPGSNIFVILAEILVKRGQNKRAVEVLRKGLGFNRDNVAGRLLLGKLYYDNWMIEQAKREFEKVLSRFPDNPEAVLHLARIERSEGDCSSALNRIENALLDNPGDSVLLSLRAEIEDEVSRKLISGFQAPADGTSKRGMVDINDAVDIIPSETLADIFMQQGHYDESVRIYEKLISVSDNPEIRCKLDKARGMMNKNRQEGK